MDFKDLSDRDRLILGLRFRLKHIRLAMAEVDAGRAPDGFEFSEDDSAEEMRAQLRTLEAEVQGMLRNHGADESGLLN
ncbi:MAG TPA: hypothetical protein VEA80_03500 [Vitreimonas sp.]|uniref:hypothetical protein n=1 Tax=Vitreimonas sp. TaxID=3069702 RepID=UPI002D73DF86|nr:hypothetical protein [Vitreimonas sp.]HYD86514.1 hypothetical protein [Vitreimonas sp.]